MSADPHGAALGKAAGLLVDAHRLAVSAGVALDGAGLELTPELVSLLEDLGCAATGMIAAADTYGHTEVERRFRLGRAA